MVDIGGVWERSVGEGEGEKHSTAMEIEQDELQASHVVNTPIRVE